MFSCYAPSHILRAAFTEDLIFIKFQVREKNIIKGILLKIMLTKSDKSQGYMLKLAKLCSFRFTDKKLVPLSRKQHKEIFFYSIDLFVQ